MGLLVDGVWRDQNSDTAASGGRFVRKDERLPQLGDAGRRAPARPGPAASRRSRVATISMSSLACPWAHRTLIMRALKGLEEAIGVSVVHWLHARARLDLRRRAGNGAGHGQRRRLPAPGLHRRRPALHRARDGARAVGQAPPHDRLQRVVRDHPHAGQRLRPRRRQAGRLLPRAAAAGDRRDQCARLRHGEQRRLQGRLRHDAGRLRGGGQAAVRDARMAGPAARRPPLPRWATRSPRPISACSRHWSASTRSMSATSSATSAGSWTCPTSGPTRATSSRSPAWRRR